MTSIIQSLNHTLSPLPQRVSRAPFALPSPRKLKARLAARTAAFNYKRINIFFRIAFFLFIFSQVFDYQDRKLIPVELPALTGTIILVLAFLFPGVSFQKFPGVLWWYVLYMLIFLMMCVSVRHIGPALNQFFLILQITLLFWMSYNLLQYQRIRRIALWMVALSGIVLAICMLTGYGVVAFYESRGKRYSLFGLEPNRLAYFISMGMVALIGSTFNLRRRPFWIHGLVWPAVAAGFLAIAQTASRGGGLAGLAGLLMLMTGGKGVLQKARNVIIGVLAVAGLIASMYTSSITRARYERSIDEGNYAGREDIFPAAWAMFTERPIQGWGPIDNKYELGIRAPIKRVHHPDYDRDTHNMYLDAMTSIGLMGSIPLFICIIVCTYAAWRARKGSEGNLPFALAVCGLIAQASLNGSFIKLFWVMLAYAIVSAEPLAMGKALVQRKRRKLKEIPVRFFAMPAASDLPVTPGIIPTGFRKPPLITHTPFTSPNFRSPAAGNRNQSPDDLGGIQ